MDSTDPSVKDPIWYDDPFHFIKPEEYESLGIDEGDIPPGTIPARRHPSYLQARFGGNAYGFGFMNYMTDLIVRILLLSIPFHSRILRI